jgi:hypothetical protein
MGNLKNLGVFTRQGSHVRSMYHPPNFSQLNQGFIIDSRPFFYDFYAVSPQALNTLQQLSTTKWQ